MEKFKGKGRVYVVIPKSVPKEEALDQGKRALKQNRNKLGITTGSVKGDELRVGVRGDVWCIWRLYKASDAIGIKGLTAKREGRQQSTASAKEQAERKAEGRTQGRKGCKKDGQRLNLLLTPENHSFIKLMSRATGQSATEYVNHIITAYQKEHSEFMQLAESFLKFVSIKEGT